MIKCTMSFNFKILFCSKEPCIMIPTITVVFCLGTLTEINILFGVANHLSLFLVWVPIFSFQSPPYCTL